MKNIVKLAVIVVIGFVIAEKYDVPVIAKDQLGLTNTNLDVKW